MGMTRRGFPSLGWASTNCDGKEGKMKKRLVCIVLGMIVVSFISSVSHSADVTRLKFNNYFATTHFVSTLLTQYCDDIKKRTNGRVEISLLSGATLTPPNRVYDGVVQGISDIGLSNPGFTRGRFPVSEIITQPLGFPDAWVSSYVANDLYAKFKMKEYDSVHPLFFFGSGPMTIQTVKKPVKTLEDLAGLKLRAIGPAADMAKLLGAIPQPLDPGDVYEALRRGVLDGTIFPLEALKAWKIGEILRYGTSSWKIGAAAVFFVVINKDKWNSLPADVKKVFDDTSAEYVEKFALAFNKADLDGLEFLKSQGGSTIPLSDAESARWIKAVQPMLDIYRKDMVAKGYTDKEVDAVEMFVKERIEYWRKAEKERKIVTPYE
jgi:TRAP-type transport system periplasmic protein